MLLEVRVPAPVIALVLEDCINVLVISTLVPAPIDTADEVPPFNPDHLIKDDPVPAVVMHVVFVGEVSMLLSTTLICPVDDVDKGQETPLMKKVIIPAELLLAVVEAPVFPKLELIKEMNPADELEYIAMPVVAKLQKQFLT